MDPGAHRREQGRRGVREFPAGRDNASVPVVGGSGGDLALAVAAVAHRAHGLGWRRPIRLRDGAGTRWTSPFRRLLTLPEAVP